jgi:hypothetical protein
MIRKCLVLGCGREQKARGLCNRHYIQKFKKEYHKNYRQEHKEQIRLWRKKHRKHLNELNRDYTVRLRTKVYTHYGNKCRCCGENEFWFLSIDHVKGNGAAHWRALKIKTMAQFYSWIIKHRYPKSLQLLCFNCNCGRYRNGGICPHKMKGGH